MSASIDNCSSDESSIEADIIVKLGPKSMVCRDKRKARASSDNFPQTKRRICRSTNWSMVVFLPLPSVMQTQITCGIMTNSKIHEYHHVHNIPEGHGKASTVPGLPFSPNSRAAASETSTIPLNR